METVKKLSSELEASPTSLTGSAGGNFHRGVGRVLVLGGQGPPAVQFCSVSDTLLKLRDPETVFHSLPTQLVSQCSPRGAGWLAGGDGLPHRECEVRNREGFIACQNALFWAEKNRPGNCSILVPQQVPVSNVPRGHLLDVCMVFN